MADDKDHVKGWTSQQGPAPQGPEAIPGNVVTYDELPYKESLVASGVNLDQYLANVVVAADEDERVAIRTGKENVSTSSKVADVKAEATKTEDKADETPTGTAPDGTPTTEADGNPNEAAPADDKAADSK